MVQGGMVDDAQTSIQIRCSETRSVTNLADADFGVAPAAYRL
jgi:hypothetical protein